MHGFQPALTSFVGRASEVGEVAGLLDECRLVTVTGPGGVGKTRLAAEVARQVAAQSADGVWQAELAAIQDPAMVPAAVASVLGLQQARGKSIIESLAAALARRQLLLVLDNCEHLLGAAAELCSALLPAADDLRILATGREPMGIGGEVRYRLSPLAVPGRGLGQQAETGTYPAVTLFVERARQSDRRFALNSETEPLAARLVQRLDGMPLAIELAAARVEALGLQQLLDRIDNRFGLLTGGNRTAPVRQQSLAATVDWSYQLLGENEKRVFRRLAIFPGPFTLDAAAMVAGAAAEPIVLRLVDCSLLTPPRASADGNARYMMLETLRAFGLERLAEAGEQTDAAAAMAGYALRAAEQAAEGLRISGTELTAAQRLDAEDATMQQGLNWALQHDPVLALRLAIALSHWWQLRGRLATGYRLLSDAASHAEPGSEAWLAAQYWLGRAAHNTGDMARALSHHTAVCDAAEQRGPSPVLVDALVGRSAGLQNLGRADEAAEDKRRALTLARELRYPAGEYRALLTLQFGAYFAGDTASVLAWAEQAERIDPATIPGDLMRGRSLFMTGFLIETGEIATAGLHCADALANARKAGDLQVETECLRFTAEIDERAGRISDAIAHLREAQTFATQIGDRMNLIQCLDIAGHICARTGRWAEAVTMWTAFTACQQHDGLVTPPDAPRRQEQLQKAALALGASRMQAAKERGAAMTLDAAAEFARMLTEPPNQQTDTNDGALEIQQLSARERELVTLVAQGSTDAQIARQLYISIRTVRSHLDRIRDKTSCRRRADLTRLAIRGGLA